MNLLVSTIVRGAGLDEPSGYLFMVDDNTRRVTSRCSAPEPALREFDANPRGGMRGAKGITVVDDRIFIANFSAIYEYDLHWRLRQIISHPSCASIHDICHRDGRLYVTSTRNDIIFEFDLEGEIHDVFNVHADVDLLAGIGRRSKNHLRRDTVLSGEIDFRDPRTHRLERFNRTHLNSVCFLPDGDMLVSLGQLMPASLEILWRTKGVLIDIGVWPAVIGASQWLRDALHLEKQANTELLVSPTLARSAVVRVRSNGDASVPLLLSQTAVPNHNVMCMPGGDVIHLDTNNGEIICFDPASGEIGSRIKVADDFLRGVHPISEQQLLVGSQTMLYAVDLHSGETMWSINLCDDPRVSVYAITGLPPRTQPLPGGLPTA